MSQFEKITYIIWNDNHLIKSLIMKKKVRLNLLFGLFITLVKVHFLNDYFGQIFIHINGTSKLKFLFYNTKYISWCNVQNVTFQIDF